MQLVSVSRSDTAESYIKCSCELLCSRVRTERSAGGNGVNACLSDNMPHAFDGTAPQAECICASFSAIECICASECTCAAVPPADPHTPASHAVHVLTTTFQAVNMLGRFSVSSWSCAATPEQCLIKRRDCSYLTQEDCGAGPFFSVSVAHSHTPLQIKSDRWFDSHAECQFRNHSVIRY